MFAFLLLVSNLKRDDAENIVTFITYK